ncbi:MAG: nuclear transport factor 2 family protein, partial [Isosphaeraceae bacterium]
MIVHAEILVVLLLSGILGPVVAQGQPERKPAEASPGGGPAMVSPEPNPDAQAIGDLLGRFIKAYNARDAKALGELFTPDAEIEDDDGDVTRGRDAIVARFTR